MNAHQNNLLAVSEHIHEQHTALIVATAFIKYSDVSVDYRARTLAHMCEYLPDLRDTIASLIDDKPDLADAFASAVAKEGSNA